MSIQCQVTGFEVEQQWLPSAPSTGVDNLLLLVFDTSSDGLLLGQASGTKDGQIVDADGDSACVTDRTNSNVGTRHSSGKSSRLNGSFPVMITD